MRRKPTEWKRDGLSASWSAPTRVLFRFCFVYFPLFFLTMIPNAWLSEFIWRVAVRFFHGSPSMLRGGSDTMFDYLRTLLCLALAVLATLVWSVLDSGRSDYDRLHRWFRYAVRLLLVFAMNVYGWDKIFLNQMPPPGPDVLLEPIGRMTPFNLLWSFIGFSSAYQILSGAAEVLAGALMLVPRFTLAGAMLGFGILTPVFILNMSYAIPVKILSFHLLLLSVFLIAPDAPRLADVFLWNRSTTPSRSFGLSSRSWVNWATGSLFAVVVLLALYLNFEIGRMRAGSLQAAKGRSIYGVWSVDEFAEGEGVHHFEGNSRWGELSLVNGDFARIRFVDGTYTELSLGFDEREKRLELSDDSNAQVPSLPKVWKSRFAFEKPDRQTLLVAGQVEGTAVRAKLHLVDVSKLPLVTSRFRWTSDSP